MQAARTSGAGAGGWSISLTLLARSPADALGRTSCDGDPAAPALVLIGAAMDAAEGRGAFKQVAALSVFSLPEASCDLGEQVPKYGETI